MQFYRSSRVPPLVTRRIGNAAGGGWRPLEMGNDRPTNRPTGGSRAVIWGSTSPRSGRPRRLSSGWPLWAPAIRSGSLDPRALVSRCSGGPTLAFDRRSDLVRCPRWLVVLPNTQDGPPRGREKLIVTTVSGNVSVQLGAPVVGVRTRAHAVNRAPVPKASVDEDGDPSGGEDDVRAASHARVWTAVLEEPESPRVEGGPNCSLGPRVRAAVADHHGADAVRAGGWSGRDRD